MRTDETKQAVIALQLVSEQLRRVEGNAHYWPWVTIGLHNALQGFMVLALCGTNDLNVLTDNSAKGRPAGYRRNDARYPESRLDKFLKLYKQAKSDRMRMYVHSQPLKPSGTQDSSVRRLNSLRNTFIHFIPRGWSLEVSGMPEMVADCVDIIAFLAFECGNIIWPEQGLEKLVKELIVNIKRDIHILKNEYGRR